ncbi:MAG: hypothetical protein U0930_08625 [Pirellulales bacterium]
MPAILTSAESLLLETSSIIEIVDDSLKNDEQAPPARLPLEVTQSQVGEVGDDELVQQLHPNGSLKVAKHVKLDVNGNYVSHGEYQEWAESGELKMSGHFNMGKRDGLWIRFCHAKESKLLETEPYNKFKAPFQSTAEFVGGKLHGLWTITDKDGKKVSEIQLAEGKRSGIATWYHSNGAVFWQSEYKNGLLDGVFTEKDSTGKVTRQTQYIQGQKAEKNSEYYANKKRKLEYQFLTPAQVPVTLDDWNSTTLATYDVKGNEVKHGTYTVYYENGSVRSQVTYNQGVQEGSFVGFFPNNQREVVGVYLGGKQHGKWSWWHENGMRKAVANYDHGVLVEAALAWNDQGERIEANELPKSLPVSTPAPISAPAPVPAANPAPSSEQSTSSSSRSASNIRRFEKQ